MKFEVIRPFRLIEPPDNNVIIPKKGSLVDFPLEIVDSPLQVKGDDDSSQIRILELLSMGKIAFIITKEARLEYDSEFTRLLERAADSQKGVQIRTSRIYSIHQKYRQQLLNTGPNR